MILAFGMAAGMVAVGRDFSIIFFGADFAVSGAIITVISPIVLFMSWSDVIRNQYLIPKKCDKEYTAAIISGAVVNIAFNAVLVPFFGAYGAAIGTVFSYLTIAAYQTWTTRKALPYTEFVKDAVPCIAFAAVMIAGVKFVARLFVTVSMLSLGTQIISGIIIYGALMLVCLRWKKDGFKGDRE
jgi:O-antigen/teichoic acid export membrane protein